MLLVLLIKKRVFKVKTTSREDFSLQLVAVDLLIPILQCTNAHLFNILIFFWIKTYCWHFWLKSDFGTRMWRILKYNLLFSSYFATVFKSYPKRLNISLSLSLSLFFFFFFFFVTTCHNWALTAKTKISFRSC